MDKDRSRVAAAPLLVLAAASLCLPVCNPDIFWHLSAGRWMAAHGAVPRTDWLSYTMAGAPWCDFEWGTQLLWYGLHRAGGMAALWALKPGGLAAAGGLLWRLLRRAGLGPAGAGLGLFAWAAALGPANDLRPENLSVVFFVLLLLLLEDIRSGRRGWPSGAGTAAWAALFAVWANLHAGFAFGLLLLAIYAACAALRERSAAPFRLLAACAAAPVLNPYGWDVFAVPLRHGAQLGLLSRHIREWGPASLRSLWNLPFWAILAAAAAGMLRRRVRSRDLPWEHLCACAVFGCWAAVHQRMAVYAVPVGILAAGAALVKEAPALTRGAGAAAAAGLAVFFGLKLLPALAGGAAFVPAFVPVRAAAFIEGEREQLAGKRLFHPWHWGGYLGYRLYPGNRVFVDGRYIFHRFLEPMHEARRSPKVYEALLTRWDAELLVLGREAVFLPEREAPGGGPLMLRPVYVSFLPVARWALVHWDRKALVFVKRGAVSPGWLKENEYRWFRPDDLRVPLRELGRAPGLLARMEAEAARFRAQTADPGEREGVDAWLRLAREASGGGSGPGR